MAAILAHSLERLRSDFNSRFPNRDKTTDGWIGDYAHQQHSSGHNPDDTPGSLSESSDADSIAEVRAIDIDKDLREGSITLLQVIKRILETPADLDRLLYIIHLGVIWSKTHNWEPREYTGVNTHEEHGHASGDPDSDEDTRPWSVLTFGEESVSSDDVIVGESILWSKASNRIDATGRNFANSVYKVISDSLGDEFETTDEKIDAVATALAAGMAQLAGILSHVQSTVDALDKKISALTPAPPAEESGLTPADHQAIQDDVKTVLREGIGQ